MRRCPVRFVSRSVYVLSTGKLDIAEGEGLGVTLNSQIPVQKVDRLASGHPIFTAIQTLQRRWVEVISGSDFISVFRVINHLPAETREKLEDRAVELAQDFSIPEIVKVSEYHIFSLVNLNFELLNTKVQKFYI